MSRRLVLALSAVLAAGVVACDGQAGAAEGGEVTVVATTEILADLVEQVGGDRVSVSSLVPSGGDPHSYEPVPADAARIARADVAFTNHLLLEPQALVKAIDSNVSEDALNVSLAENSESYGAHVIPLVENLDLDVVWLGLRVRGDADAFGADRTSEIVIRATALEGPGDLLMYLTEALGEPVVHFDSSDGFDEQDAISLPPAAHTHVNWAFTEPGEYSLTLAARLFADGQDPVDVGSETFVFAVGVDPEQMSTDGAAEVIDGGHTDLTADVDTSEMYAYTDPKVGTDQSPVPARSTVFSVPEAAVTQVPDDPRFSFLGSPGEEIYQLPQAVIGRHVHGEIDPHLWQDARNVKAYVQLIRDALVQADPAGATEFESNTTEFLTELDELHDYITTTVDRIPAERRRLITTHDAFGYLADAYGLEVAGFVVPNPAQEPSAEQVRELGASIREQDVPAVFAEPNLHERSSVLRQVAADQGVEVCQLYGDAFDERVDSYVEMMRHNAEELLGCLGAGA